MTFSRKALIALTMVVAMLLLASCTGTTTTTAGTTATTAGTTGGTTETTMMTTLPPTTITFWNGWTGPDRTTLEDEVSFFNANNKDNVTVEMDIMQHAQLTEKMHAALASNTACNVHLNFTNGEYQVNGQLVPIDTIWDYTSLQKSDFIESILDNMYYKGVLYGLPFQLSSLYLFYNKDILSANGFENPPATWEEMLTMGEACTDPANNVIGGGMVYDNSMGYAMLCLGYGGRWIEGETMDDLKSVLVDPKYIEGNKKGLEILKAEVDSGAMPTISNDDVGAAFNAGQCAMYIQGAWEVAGAKANNLNWDLTLLPAGAKGIMQPGFPIAMVLMKGTEGNELIASYKFMEFWNDNVNKKYDRPSPVYQWSYVCGYQPYLKSVANDPTLTSDPIFKVTNSYVDYLVQYRPTVFYNFFAIDSNAIVPCLQNVGQGLMSIDEALVKADQDLTAIIVDMQESGLGR